MKSLCLFLISLFTFSCQHKQHHKTTATASTPVDSIPVIIERQAKALLSDPKINALSIGIYQAGKRYTGHFGELDQGKGNRPTDTTIYEIASVSKSFTGTIVAQAVLAGKLDLEADIRKYLEGDYPNLAFEAHPIKVKHLLTHTAGLPRFFPESINDLFTNIDENLPFRIYEIEKDYSKEQFLCDLRTIRINEMPGTNYRYSNADVELMAHILENVYQVSFEQLLQQFICKKAGMSDTKVTLAAPALKRLANGYGETNQKVPHFANTLWGAGGGLKSTSADLINYMQFQLDETQQLVQTARQVLYADDHRQMGYLWPVLNNAEEGTHYCIHGGAFGTQNFLLLIPKYKLGISIITNQSGPATQGKLLHTLNNLLSDIKSRL